MLPSNRQIVCKLNFLKFHFEFHGKCIRSCIVIKGKMKLCLHDKLWQFQHAPRLSAFYVFHLTPLRTFTFACDCSFKTSTDTISLMTFNSSSSKSWARNIFEDNEEYKCYFILYYFVLFYFLLPSFCYQTLIKRTQKYKIKRQFFILFA
jgi:hypothetical protein